MSSSPCILPNHCLAIDFTPVLNNFCTAVCAPQEPPREGLLSSYPCVLTGNGRSVTLGWILLQADYGRDKERSKRTIYPEKGVHLPITVELLWILKILWEQDLHWAEKLIWLLPVDLGTRTGSCLSGGSKIHNAQEHHCFPRSCISSVSDASSPGALQALASTVPTYTGKLQIHADHSRAVSLINFVFNRGLNIAQNSSFAKWNQRAVLFLQQEFPLQNPELFHLSVHSLQRERTLLFFS